MTLTKGLHDFATELNSKQIPFAVIGGIAMFAYGSERTTFDVDLLIHTEHRDEVKSLADTLGFKVFHENKEVLQLSGAVQFDILFANREKSQRMISQAKVLGAFPYPVVQPEDLIGLKIQGFKSNPQREFIDKGDILTLFRLIKDLDFNKIKEYADVFNAWDEIEELKRRI